MGLNNLTTGGTGGLRPPGLKNLSEISAIPDSGGYLYNEGDLQDFWTVGTNEGGTATKKADHLYIFAEEENETEVVTWETNEFVDVSDYDFVEVSWTKPQTDDTNSRADIIVNDTTGTRLSGLASATFEGNWTERRTDSLDVSGINQDVVVAVSAADGTSSSAIASELETYQVRLI